MRTNGHVKLHRAITISPIYTKPPLYLRVFERLILEANWRCKRIPFGKGTLLIKRGECLTSIRQIADWVAWYERGVLRTPNPKTIHEILDWLIGENMIEMVDRSNSQVTHYNVVNYCEYQSQEAIEVTEGKQSLDTNNNINKEKKANIFTPPTVEEVSAYCQERNNSVDPQRWHDFYSAKDWMIGKNKIKDWKAAVRTWEKPRSKESAAGGYRRIV